MRARREPHLQPAAAAHVASARAGAALYFGLVRYFFLCALHKEMCTVIVILA